MSPDDLTARDHIAVQFLTGLAARPDFPNDYVEAVRQAYEIADLVLRWRSDGDKVAVLREIR